MHGDSRVWELVCLATANLPTSLPVNLLFPQSPRRTLFFAPMKDVGYQPMPEVPAI